MTFEAARLRGKKKKKKFAVKKLGISGKGRGTEVMAEEAAGGGRCEQLPPGGSKVSLERRSSEDRSQTTAAFLRNPFSKRVLKFYHASCSISKEQ